MFNSPTEFSLHIETMARDKRMTLTDSILKYCNDNSLEPDDIASLVSKSLKEKLAVEYRAVGMLPPVATLDL
jgi:hypothetical protein